MKDENRLFVSIVVGMITIGGVLVGGSIVLSKKPKPIPKVYLATCYSGGQIIFERDGVLDGREFDTGDRKYILPTNCLLEELKQ